MKNQDLMIHVERIVKPVSAIQARKLRMRTELLAHLEAAFEEEGRNFPHDERKALECAKLRLGDPAELTRNLQQTVPTVEGTLLARIPISGRAEGFEQKMARIPGKRGPMTLGHITILSGTATVSCAPLLVFLWRLSAMTASGMEPAHTTTALTGTLIAWPVLIHESHRFVFEAADSSQLSDWTTTMKRGAMLLALQIGLTFFLAATIGGRVASIGEVGVSATSTVVLLWVSTLIARQIGVLRRPYDEWLSLEIDK